MHRTPQSNHAAAAQPGSEMLGDNKKTAVSSASRRSFLGKLGTGATAAMAAGVLGSAPGALAQSGRSGNSTPTSNPRVAKALSIRSTAATNDSLVAVPPHTTNGDENTYSDKSASYSKCLLQDHIGIVNPQAWTSFKTALQSGKMSDWEAVIIGGTRTLNGPQGSYAYDLEGLDSVQYGNAPSPSDPQGFKIVPPFDKITSPNYGTQLIEMYWASLLRDVAFTDYANNSTATAAAAELTKSIGYRGAKDINGNVTPDLLFRGTFPGETVGPYVSQFMITPTAIGQQPIDQLFNTYVAGIDYMTDPQTFLQVQNGIDTGLRDQIDTVRRYLHDGRGLAALTHIDAPFQEYYNALMILGTLNAPPNPGNPYIGSRTQNGFCTFGGPDIGSSMAEVGARALIKVWYQKWLIHLTHRPEWGGGVLNQIMIGNPDGIQASLHSNVLNCQAVQQSLAKNNSFFLSQAFPEGSPAHPSYPTGHGTVAGACITILKFFYDEAFVIPNPLVPSSDGLSLLPYTGPDAGQITVGGELNKLARNVSFGHGVLAGIHWRTDTDWSMTLGEAMAISFLQNKAKTYNEKFTVTLTKLDGNKVTISN